MNINNLKIGMIIKNYKELCKVLEIEVKEGNSKKAQLKELEELVTYHKEGNKFVIDGIDDTKVEQNLSNYATIKDNNNNILVANMDKNCSTFENEIVWSKGQDKSIITNKDIYFEGEDEDELFFQIERNKHKLKLYHYYTYKKLTEVLDIKYHGSSTNSKEKQLSIIAQQVQLIKERNQYKVVRIYRVPMFRALGNIDTKNAQLYGNMLLFALVKYITENEKAKDFLNSHNYMFFGRPYLYNEMLLCNKEYNEFRYKHKELHEETKVPKDSIADFYSYTNTQMKTILQKAMKNLASRRIIKYDDKNATCIVSENGNRRVATHEEIGVIVEAETEVKKQLGINNISLYINQGKGRYFYDKVNQYIKQQIEESNEKYTSFGKDFKECYKVVLIYCTPRSLEIGYEELIDDIELALVSSNDNFVDINLEYFNNTDIEKKQIVTTKGFGKEAHEKSVFEAKYEYLQGIYLLLEKLIECGKPIAHKEAEKYLVNKDK